jgi:hypothetical protein
MGAYCIIEQKQQSVLDRLPDRRWLQRRTGHWIRPFSVLASSLPRLTDYNKPFFSKGLSPSIRVPIDPLRTDQVTWRTVARLAILRGASCPAFLIQPMLCSPEKIGTLQTDPESGVLP